jgi:solute carrier family 25 (mitochondrial phosphate transporter), member 23/24/25/41
MPAAETSLQELLTYYQTAMKMNAEGDVLIGDDTIQGLGNFATFFVNALFGSIIAVANPARHTSLSASPPYTPNLLSTLSILFPILSSPHPSTDLGTFGSSDIESDDFPLATSNMSKGLSPKARPPTTGAEAAVAVSDLRALPGAGTGGNADIAADSAAGGSSMGPSLWQELKPMLIACVPNPGYFLAGGIAGIVSRTATAPLDRLKVFLIAQTTVQPQAIEAAKSGAAITAVRGAGANLINATKELWKAGGMRSLYAGMFAMI